MIKISTREASGPIERREPFTTYGALSAQTYSRGPGLLRGTDYDRWREDVRDVTYVVYSYDTPIAWETSDGRTHRVEQRFSLTTSRHMGQARGL